MSGMWEFPGGKVEPSETESEALIRECAEELGVRIEVGVRLGAPVPVSPLITLTVWTARLAAGVPTAHEHAQLRWLSADELDTVPFLAPDRPFLPPLAALLTRS